MNTTTTKPFATLTAGDLMSHDVVAIPQHLSVRKAAHLLSDARVTGAPVIDGLGVIQAPVATYAAWMFLLQGPALPLLAAWRRGRALPRQLHGVVGVGLAGGVISLAAYGLILWAQTSGALAPIAALRESSIIFGALIGALFFGERLGRGRALAATVVVAGIALISLP
jgi:drug/metabolite transporter (DMT)-like permease